MIDHEHLLSIRAQLPQDYEPWGTQERVSGDCSCGCKWAAWLEEPHCSDWYVCTNPASHRVGLLTFEHQGCVHFEDDGEDDE